MLKKYQPAKSVKSGSIQTKQLQLQLQGKGIKCKLKIFFFILKVFI